MQKKTHDQQVALQVTDAQVKAFYQEHYDEFKAQEEVRLSHLFVTDRVEAVALLEQVKNGADFAQLSAAKSVDRASAARGGDVGFRRKAQLPPETAKLVFSLKIGVVSELLSSELLLLLLEKSLSRVNRKCC